MGQGPGSCDRSIGRTGRSQNVAIPAMFAPQENARCEKEDQSHNSGNDCDDHPYVNNGSYHGQKSADDDVDRSKANEKYDQSRHWHDTTINPDGTNELEKAGAQPDEGHLLERLGV
jgi:hypothetical protein